MKGKCCLGVKSQSGQTLVAALASLAIMAIAMGAMAALFQMQNREGRALAEKLAALDLQKTLISALADGSVCKAVLNKAGITVAPNQTPTAANPIALTLPSSSSHPATLYAFVTPGSPPTLGGPIAQVDQPASALSNSLIISSIGLQLTGGGGTTYTGSWLVSWHDSKLVRPIKSATVMTTITVDATTGAITGCLGNGGSAGGSGMWCGAFVADGAAVPNNGWAPNISQIVMPCQGKTLTCDTSMGPLSLTGGRCAFGYVPSSACPTGYSIKPIMTAMNSVNPGTPGVEGGGTPGSVNYSTLYTCTPN